MSDLPKPRLRRLSVRSWLCTSETISIKGRSPRAAYKIWKSNYLYQLEKPAREAACIAAYEQKIADEKKRCDEILAERRAGSHSLTDRMVLSNEYWRLHLAGENETRQAAIFSYLQTH